MRLLALVAFVALPGCIFEGCLPYDSVTFASPGLYRALSTEVAARGHEVSVQAPPAGIPLSDPGLDARWGEYVLVAIRWEGAGRTAQLAAEGEKRVLRIQVSGEGGDVAARETFRAFAGNVTEADDARLTRWEERLMASRASLEGHGQSGAPAAPPPGDPSPGGFLYVAEIEGPFRAERALALAGGADDARTEPDGGPGVARIAELAWELVFALPVRSVEVDGVRIQADPAGHARAGIERGPGETNAGLSAERVDQTFRSLGLTPPGLPAERYATAVC